MIPRQLGKLANGNMLDAFNCIQPPERLFEIAFRFSGVASLSAICWNGVYGGSLKRWADVWLLPIIALMQKGNKLSNWHALNSWRMRRVIGALGERLVRAASNWCVRARAARLNGRVSFVFNIFINEMNIEQYRKATKMSGESERNPLWNGGSFLFWGLRQKSATWQKILVK